MRLRFATASSLLAMAAVMAEVPTAASAQSFSATSTVVSGAANVVDGPGTTQVTLNATNTVIDWIPTATGGSGPIVFQPAGTTATYINGISTGPAYTVLNRILPTDTTRSVAFYGTVQAQLQDTLGNALGRGGSLFFYSPAGILVGPTAQFDVGSLILTTSPMCAVGTVCTIDSSGSYAFSASAPGGSVSISPGARIVAGPGGASAPLSNHYVMMVAPKVVNSGTINVDGSAVIVAADAATVTFQPDGLYSIVIDQGTSATGEVLTNDGTVTGPVGTTNAPHRVYMVAVPKNEAITMAIKGGSSLGFDVAGAADVVGNAVVLSAGYNVRDGALDAVRSKNGGTGQAALAIGAITGTSQVTGQATGQASLIVDSGNTASFKSDLLLAGVQDPAAATTDGAFISVAGLGSTLDVAGNLQLASFDGGAVAGALSSDSGSASVTVDQGTLKVGGFASISSARAPLVAVDAQSGNATLTARNSGVVSITSDLLVNASGTGKSNDDASPTGPNPAAGGTAKVSLQSGANITVKGNLSLDASGAGGGAFFNGLVGAAGFGGQALIDGAANGGLLDVTGATTLNARGIGGIGQRCTVCTVEGGAGTGGGASIIAATGSNFRFRNIVTLDASGQGGAAAADFGKDGGAGLGGAATVRTTGGSVNFEQALSVLANGLAGGGATSNSAASGATGSGGTGGSGTGGTAKIAAGDGVALGGGGSIAITGTTLVSATGTGGGGSTGGSGNGGTAALTARNGTATGTTVLLDVFGRGGTGGNGGVGGNGIGGNGDVIAYDAAEGSATVNFGDTFVDVTGIGGLGGTPSTFPDPGGAGGTGTGGRARALAEAGNGTLTLGGTSLVADGFGGVGGSGGSAFSSGAGGTGGIGGDGRGGGVTLGVVTGPLSGTATGSATFGELSISANGAGGTGGPGGSGIPTATDGNGGNGTGGTATIVAAAGVLNLTSSVLANADAVGGSSVTGAGGAAQVGGTSDPGDLRGMRLVVGTGQINGQTMFLSTSANGGTGATTGAATILGHPLSWSLNGGSINAGSLSFTSAGTPVAGAPASTIALTGGNSVVTSDFSFNTPGDLTATLDGANITAATASLSAANWLPGSAPAGTPGTLFGTTSVSLSTGADLFAHMSVNSGSALGLSAPGLVRLDDLTSPGAVGVTAGTTVSLGAIRSGADVSVIAPGNVGVGAVTATGRATLTSAAALTSGAVTTGQSTTLAGTTSLAVSGAIQAGDSIQLSSDGTVTAASLSAGLVSPSALSGATYGITVLGRGGVSLGNVAAARDVVLLSPLAIASGSITGREIAVLAGTGQTVGAITAPGRVLLADYEMSGFGGDPFVGYNLAAVLTSPVIDAGGPIAVTGPISAGALTASSVGDVTIGNAAAVRALPASGAIALKAGGKLVAGALLADDRIDLTSAGTTNLASANAGGFLSVDSTGALTAGNLGGAAGVNVKGGAAVGAGAVTASGAGSSITVTSNGAMTLASVNAAGTVDLTATGGILTSGDIAGSAVTVNGTDAVSLGGVRASTGIAVGSGADLSVLSGLTDTGNLVLTATGGITAGNLAATAGAISLNAGGALVAGNLSGLQVAGTAATGLATGTVDAAGGQITLTAAGDLSGLAMAATGTITLNSSGAGVAVGNLTSTSGAVAFSAKGAGRAGAVSARTGIAMGAGTNLALTSASTATGNVTLNAGAALTSGAAAATTGRILASAGTSAALGDMTAAGLAGGVGIRVSSGTTLSVGNAAVAAGELRLVSGGAMSAGDLAANGGILTLRSGGSLQAGALTGRDAIGLTAGGDTVLTGDAASAAGDVTMNVTGALAARAISSATGLVGIAATGNVVTGALVAGTTLSVSSSGGGITTGNAAAGTDLNLQAAGDLQAGTVSAVGNVVLAGRNASIGNVGGAAVTFSANGTLGFGDVNAADGSVSIGSAGALTGGSVTAAGRITQSNDGGGVTLGNLDAGNTVLVNGAGNVRIGNATARATTVELRATGGSLTAGNLTAATDTALIATGEITVGSVRARDMAFLAGGSVRTADLATQGGRILAASNTLGTAGGAIGEFNFDAVFAAPLIAAGGGLAITGPVNAGTFTAAVAGDAATQGITAARSILVDAGGTARLGGVWRSPVIELRANDLDMPAGSGLNAGLSGTITLVSRNAAGMRIGDGLDGGVVPATGFTLDNAEWSRINSGSFRIFARDVAGPVDILIGKLDVTGPDAGSTIDDPLGTVQFSTGASAIGASSGTIRVAGALRAVGFRSTNALVFRTGQFQLASDTGSLTMLGQGGTPTGTLSIDARDIHVAAAPLLAQLAANPFFDGVEPALDRVSAGSNGPVIRAGALDFTVGRSFYIQRTGTGFDPLGFEEPLDGFRIAQAGTSPIAVIINGTFQTATGLVSGAEAWLRFKQSGFNFSGFTADSRLNGCLLTATVCGIDLRRVPDPGIRTVIEGVDTPVLDDAPADPDKRKLTSESSILPPPLLLPVQPDALPGQIDEPIAGSGNPALIGGAAEGARP